MVPTRVRTIAVGLFTVLAFVLAGAVPLAAQATGTIRGQVTDAATQRPLAGAQISLVGTQRGGLANSSGQYLILNVPVGTYTVRAEIIGFGAQEMDVTVSAQEVALANFALSQQAIDLEELVVTGTAGRTQKRAIGNSVASVKTEAITEIAPIQDVTELLTARAPGLTLMANGGEAGAGSKIRIRGAGSLNAGLDPVIYVDGVRIESSLQGTFDSGWGGSQANSPLDAINPDDIESIEVIKGPAAATLYGAEAAGGVIQIITKKGRAGIQGIQWTIQSDYGQTDWGVVDTPTNYWLCTESNIGSSSYPGCSVFSPSQPEEERILSMNPIQDDPVTNRTGNNYGVNLSARGGAETYNYYLSFENGEEQGVFYNNFARRTGGRANFGFVPTSNLNFNVNVGFVKTRNRMPLNNNASNGILRNGFRGRAGAMNDPWKSGYRGFSPELSNEYNQQVWGERLTMGITANYNPTEWFSNRLTLGLDRDDRTNREFYQIDTTGRRPWGSTNSLGRNQTQFPLTHRWTVDYSGTVNFDFAEDYTSAFSAGMQLNARQRVNNDIDGIGLIANNINLVSQAATSSAGQSRSEQTSLGFFVQEQVGWQDKLFVTAAIRVDDNSAFGEDFSLVVYPKASVSYVISDEDWFQYDFVDQLKLRGAWGQAGNAPAPFSADRTFGTSQTTFQDATVNYLNFGAYGNPDLKAETGQEIELGFESSLFEGKVGLDLTYYYQQTKDALISIPDPPSSGWSGSHLINIGEIKNTGLEIMVNSSPVHTRNVEWNSTAGISFNTNELVSFGRYPDGSTILDEVTFGSFASVQRHREGYPLGGFWSIDVLRDANGLPFLDSNDNAMVLDDCVWKPSDPNWSKDQCQENYEGPMLPTREIAWTNTLTLFGNWRLFANLDYKGGHQQWSAMNSINARVDRNTKFINTPNPDPDTYKEIRAARSLQTKKWIMPADFIKLRELSLSYTLPTVWAAKAGAGRATITLSGRNLWYTTDYKLREVMYDPEVTFWSLSNFTQLDYASMPMMRHWMVSMRVGF
jgi:TonB-linked SusC/RagA family outer membrane protein